MIWTRYSGTAAKAGGNGENKLRPVVMGDSCLLESDGPPWRDKKCAELLHCIISLTETLVLKFGKSGLGQGIMGKQLLEKVIN